MCEDISVCGGNCGDWCQYGGGDGDDFGVRCGAEEQAPGWHAVIPGFFFDKHTDITLAICLARCSFPDLIRCKWSV